MAAPKVSGYAFGGGEAHSQSTEGILRLVARLDRAEHPERSTAAVFDTGDRTTPLPPQAPPCRLHILLNGPEILQDPDPSVPCRDTDGWSCRSRCNPSFYASH